MIKGAQINYVSRNRLHCTANLNFGLMCKTANFLFLFNSKEHFFKITNQTNLVNFFWLVEKFVIILNSRLVICNTTHFNQYMVKNQSKKHDFFSHRIFFIYILKMLVNSGLHWLLTCDEKDNKNTWKYDMNTSVAKARRVLPASHLLRRAVRRQSLCKLCTVAMNELLCSKNSGA